MALSKGHMAVIAERFCEAKSLKQLALAVGVTTNELALHAHAPSYHSFSILKPDGSQRCIEAPNPPLKSILRKLKVALQCVYYFAKSPAAYGYILHPPNEKDKRTIFTNAAAHLNNPFLLNVDLEDFFHQITEDRVRELMRMRPFRFDKTAAEMLARLFTYNGRLPMGSPSSPPLSNLCSLGLDNELLAFAVRNSIRYTRFVDDLSFSGQRPLDLGQFNELEDICRSHGYRINHEKIRSFGRRDEKIVTGILVGDELDVSESFKNALRNDIEGLHHLIRAEQFGNRGKPSQMVSRVIQQINGRINFMEQVNRSNLRRGEALRRELEEKRAMRTEPMLVDWTDLPYHLD